jgi:hypothetical protein
MRLPGVGRSDWFSRRMSARSSLIGCHARVPTTQDDSISNADAGFADAMAITRPNCDGPKFAHDGSAACFFAIGSACCDHAIPGVACTLPKIAHAPVVVTENATGETRAGERAVDAPE